MKILVLWAREGATNLGVQALGEGTRALAARAFPGAEVRTHGTGGAALPGNDGPANIFRPKRMALEAVRGGEFKRWLKSFDLVLDTRAGDSFAEIYGLEQLAKMTPVGELAQRWGVPVVLTPQTIGPFDSRRGRALARRSIHTAALVMTRDSRSARVASALGRVPDVVASDVVFVIDQPAPAKVRRDVMLNVSGLLWAPNPHVDHLRYRALLVDVLERLDKAGRKVTLLGHVVHQDVQVGDNDTYAIHELKHLTRGDHEVLLPRSLSHVRSEISGANLVVGSRMHACLNAISVGVPAVPLAYSDKFQPLLQDIGLEDMTVDLRQGGDTLGGVLQVIGSGDLLRRTEAARVVANEKLGAAVSALRGLGLGSGPMDEVTEQ